MSLAKATQFELEPFDDADAWADIELPPSDLYSDEPPLETELHLRQLMLLIQCLERWWHDRQDFYAFGNLTIYYSPRQRKTEKFRGPDFLWCWAPSAALARAGWCGKKTANIPT